MPKSRTLLGVALSGLALVMVAAPVAAHGAGDGDTHRGKVGRHAFADSETKPGARCVYRATEPTADEASVSDVAAELVGVSVRPPKVAAINRTKRVDRQAVAWRFVLQEKVGEGDWTAVKRSRLQLKKTTDKRAADFARLAVRYDGNPEADYRVKTKAFWLKNRNPLKKVGLAAHLVDYYRVRGELMKSSCPGGVPTPEAP